MRLTNKNARKKLMNNELFTWTLMTAENFLPEVAVYLLNL